ncbi:hypothetical protein [Bacillus sp. Marseille-P3800]|uniref:hypothetical protein n=1 Tax=Bacillus sp. Marseille-P3800 TaxID=2014782 RepID=UPI000C08C128|nr:hypothetical protein [Bacillus sp. Marseille-P3800]
MTIEQLQSQLVTGVEVEETDNGYRADFTETNGDQFLLAKTKTLEKMYEVLKGHRLINTEESYQ